MRSTIHFYKSTRAPVTPYAFIHAPHTLPPHITMLRTESVPPLNVLTPRRLYGARHGLLATLWHPCLAQTTPTTALHALKKCCQRCNALISHTLQLAKIIRARTNCPLHCLRGQTRPRLLDPAATPLAVLQSFARRCAHMASSVQHGYTSQRMSTQRGAHAKTLGATCGSRLGLRAPRCCPGLRAPRPCGRHTCISCAWARESARASR